MSASLSSHSYSAGRWRAPGGRLCLRRGGGPAAPGRGHGRGRPQRYGPARGPRPAHRARRGLGRVLRPADSGGPRGVRAPPPHRVPGPPGRPPAPAGAGAVVVDLCCGTGALGVALAAAGGPVELHATDVDTAAVRCARRNVATVGGRVYQGDLFGRCPPRCAARLPSCWPTCPTCPPVRSGCCPPEARDHEARQALDGGAGRPGRPAAGDDRGARVAGARRPPAVRDQRAPGGRGGLGRHRRRADPQVARCPDLAATVIIAACPEHRPGFASLRRA